MGVFDKWLRGVSSPDRDRKPTPSRPASTIGNTVRNRQTPPVRSVEAPRPAVPVKHHSGIPVADVPAPAPAETDKPAAVSVVKPSTDTASSAFDPVLQRKLDRYFDRLRAVYPTGVISRLNTGHKKLAERGAQLRRMCNMENELDAFFALGGFTYERTAGGRPRNVQNPAAQDALVTDVKTLFPQGISSAAVLDRADHALYLRLRSAARLSGQTLTEFLKNNNLNT